MSTDRHVVIAGGGITGLSAAHHLLAAGDAAPHVTLLEADDRLGGKIRTVPVGGRPLDVGAEALLTRQPAALALCRELGLGEDLVAPAAGQAFVWLDRLRPLPPGLLAGAPDGAGAIVRSGALSPKGLLRAGLDLVLPATPVTQDVSIGELVRRRCGDEVLERLIDPLLGGIHAGRCDALSVRATAPQLAMALADHRSLVRGLRAMARNAPAGPGGPPFMTLRGGLRELVDRLAERLEGVDVSLSATVAAIEPASGGRLRVVLADGDELTADDVVLATPAHAAAGILEASCPGLAAQLGAIVYASVATVALAFDPADVQLPAGASGLLVPPSMRRTITASTWSSSKWAHLSGGPVLVKCAVGADGRDDAVTLDDETMTARVLADLHEAAGIDAVPQEVHITRFPRALPQYRVGHLDRVAQIAAASDAPEGLHLAGAAYRGVGVAACIKDGALAAERIAGRHGTPAAAPTP